ncbi:MAG: GntR family transcriptional regulator, partial [Candidatus Omnitrophica bacterium]|nr:GntR family transcriptional regulator [Candidatus Omnitrophota bacterium]
MNTLSETREPLWKTICDDLRKQINRYQYAQKFFTTAEICEKYAVSQITARRALLELEKDGLVEMIRRRGTIVRSVVNTRTIHFVIPRDMNLHETLSQPIPFKIYSAVVSEIEKMKLDFHVIGEDYLPSVISRNIPYTGFIILQGLLRKNNEDFLREKNMPCVFAHALSRRPD